MSDFKAKITAELDTSKVEQQLNQLGKDKKIKLDVDTGNTDKNINNVNKSIQTTGKTAQTFGDTLKKSLNIGSAAAITAKGLQLINTTAKKAVASVKEFDDAITDLRMATGQSYDSVRTLVQGYNEMGQALGATTKEVSESADAWLRQGKTAQETNQLIQDSMMLSKIGQIDSASATEYLTSAMKGYGIEVQNVQGIVDKLCAVDLVSATDAAGLAEAMSRTAVTADMAGVSMDRLLGYLATVGETTQKSMSSIGESFKTIFTRMHDIKADKLELVDEDGTTELLSDVELTLKNVGIDLRATVTEFDNAGDVLDNLHDKWNTLNSVQQAALSKAFAGTRQAENFRVLMQNYDTAKQYMETAANSAGTAEEKFSAYLDSIEAKTKTLQAAFESLSINTFSTELIGGVVEAATAVLQFLDETNLLKGALTGLAVAGVVKGFTTLATGISNAAIKMNEFNSALKLLKAGSIGEAEIEQLATMTANLSQSQLKAVLSSKALSTEQRVAILTAQGMSTAEAQAAVASMGLATAEGAATASTFSLSGALKGLWATLMANPLILVIAGVTAAVSAYSSYKQKVEEARQASLEAGNAARDEAKNISSLYNAYSQAKSAYDSNTGSKETLEGATDSLLSALGIEEAQIQRLEEEYGSLDAAINQVTYDSLKEKLSDMTAAYQAAQDEMMSAASDSMGWFSGDSITVSTHGEDKKFAEVLQAAGYLEENLPKWSTSLYTGINDYGDIDSLMESYQELLNMRESLEQGVEDGLYTRKELSESDVYTDINAKINAVKAEYEDVLDYANQINSLAAQLQYMDYVGANGIPETTTEFETLRSTMLSTAEASGQFVGSEEQIADAINNTLASTPELSEFFDDYSSAADEAVKTVEEKMAAIRDVFKNGVSGQSDADFQIDSFDEWLSSLDERNLDLVYEISLNTESAQYSLDEWQNALDNAQFHFEDLMAEEDTDDADSFSTQVTNYVEKIQTLQEALENYKSGDFKNEDLIELITEFPELAGESDNLGNAIVNLAKDLTGGEDALGNFSGIYAVFQDQFGRLDSEEDRQQLQDFMDTVLELGQVVGDTQFSIDIDAETAGMENLWTAMKESVSSTGLTADSISNLKARYQDLENYDAAKLFEKTANGVHLNTSALRELEAEYESTKKTQIDSDLDSLVEQYNDLTEQINNASDAATTADLYAKRADIQNQIEDTAMLATQYEGLTSAFYKWEQAQSIGEEGDMYDSLAGSLEDIKQLYDDGLIGTNQFRTAVQLMSNQDLSTASIDELLAAYESGYGTMTRYFQDSSDGCLNFLHDVENLNSEWAKMNDDGSWEIDFGVGDDQKIADALGINVESVQAILRKLSDYGFDINLDSMYSSLDLLESEAEAANDKLKELGATDYTFNFNTTDIEYLDEQIEEAQNALDTFRNTDGTINLEADGAEEAQAILATLIGQKQSLDKAAILSVDTSNANSEIETVIGKLQEFKSSYNKLDVQAQVGADTTQAQADVDAALASLSSEHAEILASLGIDTSSADAAIASINALTPEVMVTCGLDASLIEGYQAAEHDASGTVIWDNNIDKVTSWIAQSHTASGTVNWSNNTSNVKTYFTATGTVNWKNGGGGAAGTAHAQGTAKANGDWGTKESGTALGGELGQELIVRNGKFFTIGDNGAEFFQYKKGDIIFNADQTEEIFKKGRLTGNSPRGRLYYTGTAFSSGTGKITASGKVKTTPSGSGKSSGGSGGSSGGSSSSQKEDEPEKIDWIEIAIDRIERAIKRLQTTAESTFKSFKKRLTATNSEISKVTEELSLQQKAYNRYIQEANSVGLSSSLAQKVKDGTIDINEYDSDTAELIQEYQEWYEKALDCKDAIDELNESLSQLYKDNFDNVATQFDHEISLIEHLTNTYNNGLDLLAAKGYFASTKYYDALKQAEQSNKDKLNQELTSLINAYSTAMNSGAIDKNSEAWYEMQEEINAVKEAIQECDIQLAEFDKSIQELNWEIFDYIEDRISQIASEADFFVSLMSNSDLFTDKGQLTDTGMATMGLYGVNYNTYMAQADQYAEEIKKLNKEIADDPYDTDLIARREELLQLQQEAILAAEDEKQAIVDLVEEGIEIELDALKELIDAYTDSLDSAKDLYDYQKKVAEQTAEIASIEKQLSAYKNDTSEEAKATVQKLKVELSEAQDDLEETEYDQYISDQKKMLDDLYDEYEMILNQRLDDIDALITDMIDNINANSSSIEQTISDQASAVGYMITDGMKEIWSNDGGANSIITKYGDSFTSQLTAVNNVLNAISANVASMIKASDTAATTTTSTASTTTSATKSTTPSTNKSTTTSTKSSSSSNKYNDSVKQGVAAAIWIYGGSKSGWGNDPQRKQRLTAKFGSANAAAIQSYINAHGSNGDLYKYWVKSGKSKLSQYYYSAFKTGGLADYTGMAWLDGTPTKPEMVLNPDDTENFIALKDAMVSVANGNSPLAALFSGGDFNGMVNDLVPLRNTSDIANQLSSIVSAANGVGGTSIGEINYEVNIPIDHVDDYDDLVNKMINDGEFEKFIQAITLDRLAKKSKLAKYKYLRN